MLKRSIRFGLGFVDSTALERTGQFGGIMFAIKDEIGKLEEFTNRLTKLATFTKSGNYLLRLASSNPWRDRDAKKNFDSATVCDLCFGPGDVGI